MKRLLKWISLIGLTLGISIAIALGIYAKLSTETIAKIEENTKEQAPSICESNRTIRVVEEQIIEPGVLYRPTAAQGDNGQEVLLYCVEPGAAISTNGTPRSYIQSICARSPYSGCRHTEWGGIISDPYYECERIHYSETYSGTIAYSGKPVDDLYDVAYIASYYPEGNTSIVLGSSWGGQIQQAFWYTALSSHVEDRNIEGGKLVYQDALNYQTFYNEILEEDEYGRTGMKPTDNTDLDNIKLNPDETKEIQAENTHTLGPFKVDYVIGKNSSDSHMAFGGISDMYLVDQDGNRVDITMLIRFEQDESYAEPSYWTHIDYTNDPDRY